MKIKLDENLGRSVAQVFSGAGHDVETVRQENLSGASDRRILEICQMEERCLVTLDLDFSNPLIFDPALYHGIAVLRVPVNPAYQDFSAYSENLIRGLSLDNIRGKLWIVQRNRIRIYQPE